MKFKRILAMGAHPDDVEFGCGGTLILMKKHAAKIRYIVFSKCTDLPRNKGIEKEWGKASEMLTTNSSEAKLLDFPNRLLFSKEAEIREVLEEHRDEWNPDLVFTHSLDDIHQDHTIVRDEARKVFKRCTLLGYESPRSSVQFSPNVYIPIPESVAQEKIHLLGCYQTQQSLPYADSLKITAALYHHGTKIDAKYAEAFNLIRGVFQF